MNIYSIALVSIITFYMTVSNSLAAPTHSNSTGQLSSIVSGEVVDTMDGGGYTYVGVKVSNGHIMWAAGPKTVVSKGQSVSFDKGTEMRGFTSPTLKRTFKTIYFTSAFRVSGAPASSKLNEGAKALPQGTDSKTKMPNLPTSGFSVEQLFTQSNTLSGKQVTFRGKVVKFNAGIMGKNWLHVQDGSGAAKSKTHDITVTTNANAAVGDAVVIKGTLVTDKDFGAGYRYAVIIENASVTKN